MKDFGELSDFIKSSENTKSHYTKSNSEEKKHTNEKRHNKRPEARRVPELKMLEPKEKKNLFSLDVTLTNRGIPVVPEFATDTKSRFIIFTGGALKRPIWVPDKILENGIQALIPVKKGNLLVEYDTETQIISVYKINFIDIKNEKISLYLYNRCVEGKWDKDIFESLEFIAESAKKKVEDKGFVCYSTEPQKYNEKEKSESTEVIEGTDENSDLLEKTEPEE